MKNFAKNRMFRAAALMLCGAGLVVSAAFAQQDSAPPPPDGQQQGPPPDGAMQGPGGHRGMNPERRIEMMQRRLNLSDDQTAQVRQIFADSRTKMEALRSNTSMSHEDRRAQMMALHQDEQAKVRALLNPDQQAKFDEMMARMRERRGEAAEGQGGSPQAPPPPPSSDPQL
ncbi:MAG: hypothetical protein WBY53_19735 [Acidobacteriaceae bacterium]